MSQLSTNTIDLQAILAQVNALPDVGSSGSGSVETCTVICNVAMTSPGMEPINIYYIDELGEPQNVDFTLVETITAQKNSYIFISGWSGSSTSSGEIVEEYYMNQCALFYITGDATLEYYE